jgi:hypothetical protein
MKRSLGADFCGSLNKFQTCHETILEEASTNSCSSNGTYHQFRKVSGFSFEDNEIELEPSKKRKMTSEV